MTAEIDHIIWATNTPKRDRAWFQDAAGTSVVPGGPHPGFGTRNELIGLTNDGLYLEIIYPDPEQDSTGTIAQAMTTLTSGGVYHWAARHSDLDALAETADTHGIAHTGKIPVSRTLSDGTVIAWHLLFLRGHGLGGVIPFFIDWGTAPHPSKSLPASYRLGALTLHSPKPKAVIAMLGLFGLSVSTVKADAPSITAVMTDGAQSLILPAAKPFKDGFSV